MTDVVRCGDARSTRHSPHWDLPSIICCSSFKSFISIIFEFSSFCRTIAVSEKWWSCQRYLRQEKQTRCLPELGYKPTRLQMDTLHLHHTNTWDQRGQNWANNHNSQAEFCLPTVGNIWEAGGRRGHLTILTHYQRRGERRGEERREERRGYTNVKLFKHLGVFMSLTAVCGHVSP